MRHIWDHAQFNTFVCTSKEVDAARGKKRTSVLQKYKKYKEVRRSTEKYREVPGSTKKYLEVRRSTKKYQEVRRSTEKYGEVPRSTEKYQEVRRSTEKYQEVPRSTEKYWEVLGSTKEVRFTSSIFFPQTEQKCSGIAQCQKLNSQQQNKNVLVLEIEFLLLRNNKRSLFCFW